MNILVTGAGGKVGSRLVPHLLNAGHRVRLLVRNKSKQPLPALEALGAQLYQGDVLAEESLPAALSGCDAVVHLAALFRTDDAKQIRVVNVEGTQNLARAALAANQTMRFIFASTNLVYDSTKGPAKENDPISPNAPYPVSKKAAEDMLRKLHRTAGLDVRILRFAFVYGAEDPHLEEAVQLFEAWRMHPAQRLHLVHHLDIAQAIEAHLRTPGLNGAIHNVADDSPITVQEILEVIGKDANLPDPTDPLTNPWKGLVSTAMVRQDVGYRPLVPSLYAARDLRVL